MLKPEDVIFIYKDNALIAHAGGQTVRVVLHWSNDGLSFFKIGKNHVRCSLQQTVEVTAHMLDTRIRKAERAEKTKKEESDSLDPNIKSLIDKYFETHSTEEEREKLIRYCKESGAKNG